MREAYAVTHFCDDIRAEVGGKFSYMGIYGADLLLAGPLPAMLPKLAFATSIWIPSERKVTIIRVRILRETGDEHEELLSADLPFNTPDNLEEGTFSVANIHLQAVPFQISTNCVLLVRVYLDGDELQAGQIQIHQTSLTEEPPTRHS